MWKVVKDVECPVCGKVFQTNRYKKYCSKECGLKMKRIGDKRRAAQRKRLKEEQSRQKPNTGIIDVETLARAEGLSYGKYVAKHGYKL